MKKNIVYYLIGMFLMITSCTDKDEQVEGKGAIKLSGLITRAESPRNNIYIKAFHTGAPSVYFNETLASIPTGLSVTDSHDIVFSGASPYYPLGEDDIRIFAYSGSAPDNRMVLTSGTDINNDAVLSNYGKRRDDAAVDPDYAPAGTPGSSSNPAELLQFRHVMTQLTVDIALGDPAVDPIPQRLDFTLDGGVVARGRYPIRGTESNVAIDTTGTYTIHLGTNYLVPTGIDLLGKKLKSLVIDNYTATKTDLDRFIIEAQEGQTSMQLMPGYAYRLTFTINRLKVTGITLTKIDWSAHETSGNISYDPSTLTLDLGTSYQNTGDDMVNKVVLETTEGKTYIGKAVTGETGLKFVTLPATGVNKVTLYTPKGLLLTSDITSEYSNNTLTLPISAGGMLPENPNDVPGVDNPYMITTSVQFMNVAKDLTANYKQAITIDLNTLNLIESVRVFNGFRDFSGTYDGNGYRIDGLDIQAAGLFDSNSGTLRNIRISTGAIDASGLGAAGSMCGENSGTIVGCINEARLVNTPGSNSPQGGICGINTQSGSVIACINTGTILNGTIVGGICGNNQNTGANTLVACINTGMLNPEATSLGFLCGTSVDSSATVINTCFGLVGSAQHVLGGPEDHIGTGTVEINDTSTLEPPILRNNLETGVTDESRRVVNRLNAAIATTAWSGIYQYVFNNAVTAITWPAPMKVN